MKNKVLKIVNRETISYAFFGVLTSVLNIVLFHILTEKQMDYKYANIITLIVVKLVAYVCNKNFVFQSKTENMFELCKEFVRFVIARGVTMLVDYFGLIAMVEILSMDQMISKCILTVVVIVLNYVLGKRHVFKKHS